MKYIDCPKCWKKELARKKGKYYICRNCKNQFAQETIKDRISEYKDRILESSDADSFKIKIYLDKARNAYQSKQYLEAEKYADIILNELNIDCAEAWEIKGCSAMWTGTFADWRTNEKLDCWAKARELSSKSEWEEMKRRIQKEEKEVAKVFR